MSNLTISGACRTQAVRTSSSSRRSRLLNSARLALLSGALLSLPLPAALAQDAMSEATALLLRQAKGTGREMFTPETAVAFKESDKVFLKSALAIDFTYRNATVTLPLFRGLSPDGEPVYYIITEASELPLYNLQAGLPWLMAW